jgi:hypothetical protein
MDYQDSARLEEYLPEKRKTVAEKLADLGCIVVNCWRSVRQRSMGSFRSWRIQRVKL